MGYYYIIIKGGFAARNGGKAMTLSIINGWEEGHFKAVASKGLHGIEFCANDRYDSAEILAKADEIKANSEKYDVKVVSIGRWGMTRLDESGNIIPEAQAHDKNLITLASIVGCPVFNVGVNRVEALSYYDKCQAAIRYLAELIEFGRDKGVKIAVYNCDWANFIYEEKAWAVVLGALPELGIKYDISHCLSRSGDYLREMRDWGGRFYHVHIKGALYISNDHFDDPPAGLDQIDWRSAMALLYCADYNGALSIEPHSRRWSGKKGQWGVDYTIKFISQFIMPDDYECVDDPYMP